MGKRERHAAKKDAIQEMAQGNAPLRARVRRLGFISGLGWGWGALRLGLAHPIYFGVGYVMLALMVAILVAIVAWAPSLAVGVGPLAGFGAVVGLACLGSAARAMARKREYDPAPWGAWIEPLRGAGNAGRTMGRAALLFIGLLGFAAWGDWMQAQMVASLASGADGQAMATSLSWDARIMSFVMVFVFAAWMIAATAPASGVREWLNVALTGILSPLAMFGVGAFWLAWLMACEFGLSLALSLAGQAAAGQEALGGAVAGPADMFMFASLVMMGLCAPLIAMSMAFASGAISLRHKALEEERAWIAAEREALNDRFAGGAERAGL